MTANAMSQVNEKCRTRLMCDDLYYCLVEDSCFCPYVVNFGDYFICQHRRKADYAREIGKKGSDDN